MLLDPFTALSSSDKSTGESSSKMDWVDGPEERRCLNSADAFVLYNRERFNNLSLHGVNFGKAASKQVDIDTKEQVTVRKGFFLMSS